MPDSDLLEVVDENDQVIGLETRAKIHAEGLLHREVHIWFVTPKGEIIFQHRSKDKEYRPDKLDATVGGHVEPGMTYEETAIKEAEEETGIHIDAAKLIYLGTIRRRSYQSELNFTNNSWRHQYGYFYKGDVKDLKIEEGKGAGFEVWSVDNLFNLTEAQRDRFIPDFLQPETLAILEKAKTIFLK